MKIKNSFTIDVPIDQAWALLTDLRAVAPCLPGANLSGEEGGVYSGSVKIKIGPVIAEYRGSAEFVELDALAYRAVIDGQGKDTRGAGNAQALITAEMHNLGSQTQVDVSTDLKVAGKVAQFGRRVLQDVSEKLVAQFATCLAARLDGSAAVEATTALEAIAAVGADGVVAGESTQNPGAVVGASARAGARDDQALDLLDVAGAAVFKRLVPLAVVTIVAVIALFLILG